MNGILQCICYVCNIPVSLYIEGIFINLSYVYGNDVYIYNLI